MGVTILYCRGRTPYTFLPSELAELERVVGTIDQSWVNDEDGSGFQKATEAAKGGTLVVYRIEHLAKAMHRATRLRKIVAAGVSLKVIYPFALQGVDWAKVAEYSEQLLEAYIEERNVEIRDGQQVAKSSDHPPGRPRNCECEHPKINHPLGGPCNECQTCPGYRPRTV